MRLNMVNIDHPGKIADFITSILNIERSEQQTILETANVQSRMEKVLTFVGDVIPRKNQKYLVSVMRHLPENYRLMLVGHDVEVDQQQISDTVAGQADSCMAAYSAKPDDCGRSVPDPVEALRPEELGGAGEAFLRGA
jgi:ATP-dependent Lon protease